MFGGGEKVMGRIRTVFLLTAACLSGCVNSSDDAATDERSPSGAPNDAQAAIKRILETEMTPEARMNALEPYLDIGRSQKEIEQVLGGFNGISGSGPGFFDADYGDFGNPGLQIAYY